MIGSVLAGDKFAQVTGQTYRLRDTPVGCGTDHPSYWHPNVRRPLAGGVIPTVRVCSLEKVAGWNRRKPLGHPKEWEQL
jgi:hypothetical protein